MAQSRMKTVDSWYWPEVEENPNDGKSKSGYEKHEKVIVAVVDVADKRSMMDVDGLIVLVVLTAGVGARHHYQTCLIMRTLYRRATTGWPSTTTAHPREADTQSGEWWWDGESS